MSTSTLSLTRTRELIINFIKKYQDSMLDCVGEKITDKFINDLEALNLKKFFYEILPISAKFGSHFRPFSLFKKNNTLSVALWMCDHKSATDLTKKINDCKDKEALMRLFENKGGWHNLTETRMKALEKIFDQLSTKSKTKTAKKTAKKTEVVITISDTTEIQNDIAFVNFDADKFIHLMKQGGNNFDPFISDADNLDVQNQIDHAINAFKLAKKELEDFISELVRAKDAGAKHVVASSWCKRKDFDFKK